jgi:hypothetical protein
MPQSRSFGDCADVKNYLIKTFSIDVDGASLPTQPSLLINKEERAAFTLTSTPA